MYKKKPYQFEQRDLRVYTFKKICKFDYNFKVKTVIDILVRIF